MKDKKTLEVTDTWIISFLDLRSELEESRQKQLKNLEKGDREYETSRYRA